MNTVNVNAINRGKYSSEDFNPLIGVSDGHLLVNSRPGRTGTFSVSPLQYLGQPTTAQLPSFLAKSFRITNAGSSNVDVQQRSLISAHYFDDQNVNLLPDSPSLGLEVIEDATPLGNSAVLKIVYLADTAAYANIPVIPLESNFVYQVLFKITDIQEDMQPLGIYTERSSIDINFPAAAIRIKPDLSIVARVGYTDETISGSNPITLGTWHRATITTTGTDFAIQVESYAASSFTKLVPDAVITNFSSIGAGLLDEIALRQNYVVGFASEGEGTQFIDSFEVYRGTQATETLIAGTTKEYFCNNSLDEFTVNGPVTGYYRS